MSNKKTKRKKGFSLDNLTLGDWIIICFFAVLIFVPDPVDALTFGAPVLESLIALIYTLSMGYLRR